MPGHTPEERVKSDVARTVQPGPDRQGGSAAVSNDAGSQSTIGRWREYLRRPEVVAGLLQFSTQMLQTNPGGFGPAFGTSLAAGLGAAGRVSKLQREQGQEREDRSSASRQQDLENALDERRVTEIEKRTEILGRPKVGKSGKSDKELTLAKQYEEFFQGDPEFGEEILDPGTLGRLGRSASAATNDVDGDFMAACQAIGNTARSCAETYMDEQLRRDMKFTTGLLVKAGAQGDGTADPDVEDKDELTPGVPEFPPRSGGRAGGGLISSNSQIQSEITKVKADLAALQEKPPVAKGRGGLEEAKRVRARKVEKLNKRIAELNSQLGE